MAKLTKTEWEEIAAVGFLVALIAWIIYHATRPGVDGSAAPLQLPAVGGSSVALPGVSLPGMDFPVSQAGDLNISPSFASDTPVALGGSSPVDISGCGGCGGGCGDGCGGSVSDTPSTLNQLNFIKVPAPVTITHATMAQLHAEFPGQVILNG